MQITLTLDRTTCNPGGWVHLTATVSPAPATRDIVTFADGSAALPPIRMTNGVAVLVRSFDAVGPHSLTASYGGVTSAPAILDVAPKTPPGCTPNPNCEAGSYAPFPGLPLFGPAGPSYLDVAQHRAGDCPFEGTLAAMAIFWPDVVRSMIADNGDGTYTVRLYSYPGPITAAPPTMSTFRFDNQLPASLGNPTYAGLGPNKVLWVALLEKAVAYFFRAANVPPIHDYASLIGGEPNQAVLMLSGKQSRIIYPSDNWPAQVATALAAKVPTMLATATGVPGALLQPHCYAFQAISATTATLYDPNGQTVVKPLSVIAPQVGTITFAGQQPDQPLHL